MWETIFLVKSMKSDDDDDYKLSDLHLLHPALYFYLILYIY